MKLADESNVCLDKTNYKLTKADPRDGDGYILTIDRPDKAQESSFLPLDITKALYYLLNSKTTPPCR